MKKDNQFRCPICNSSKYKILHTHGKKSRGVKICRRCKK